MIKFVRFLAFIALSIASLGLAVVIGAAFSNIVGEPSTAENRAYSIFALPPILAIWVVMSAWLHARLIEPGRVPGPDQRKSGRGLLWICATLLAMYSAAHVSGAVDFGSGAGVPLSTIIPGIIYLGTIVAHFRWPRLANKEATLPRDELPESVATPVTSAELDADYKEKIAVYERLREQIAIYDEKLSFIELGVYDPHFEFDDSERYKEEITKVRARQKEMVASKGSCSYPADMMLDGSLSKGKAMMNRQMRLTMRAFNNECEAAISNTRWNNVNAMEKRILNAAKQINDTNKSLGMEITDEYVALKLDELYLTHECREQQKAEKDERAERARQEREEKALIKAAERAEQKEAQRRQALEQARAEAAAGAATEEMLQRIEKLERELEEAHAETERARSMAEKTKSGYVYVISNVGAFGEDVVKIGLTRRLDPEDRVKELSDASVPFSFDTHAMIYSDEAPMLEAALHKEFTDRRVNMANLRKEFFRVSLDEVEAAVQRLAPDASFFKSQEAQEWHETLARRNEMLKGAEDEFPSSLSA